MIFYRRNLPHILIPDYIFFVTTRLAGSLPLKKLEDLRKEFLLERPKIKKLENLQKKRSLKEEIHRRMFLKYEALLHNFHYGP